MYKKVSGSAVVFLVLYVDDILLIRNEVSVLQYVNILVIQEYSPWKTLEKQPNHWGYRSIEIARGGCLVFHILYT